MSPFYVHVDSAPRDLHSFPTRRSSDLAPPGVAIEAVQPQRADALGDRLVAHGQQASLAGGEILVGVEREAGRIADRKSTRLNSSHSSISYAVFCLKKKNRQMWSAPPSA